eukprot:COSAG06_NODE_2535_length_6709_cov_136.464145_2_plen_153_part_00
MAAAAIAAPPRGDPNSTVITRPGRMATGVQQAVGAPQQAAGAQQAELRQIFLAPSWQDQQPHDRTQPQGDEPQAVEPRSFDPAERLWEPQDEPGLWRLRTAEHLRGYRAYAPPKSLAATHWSRRPVPPGPPPSLTRCALHSCTLAAHSTRLP